MLRRARHHTRPTKLSPLFQWAPTLGGECYVLRLYAMLFDDLFAEFQWAPTLGGECYLLFEFVLRSGGGPDCMFQWAPTLGGECYKWGSLRSLEVIRCAF